MIKEIIINKNSIKDDQITEKRVINKYILIHDNFIYLKKHHNTYFFLDDEDINDKSNLKVIKKEYIRDYPFIGENTLNIINYYLVDAKYGEGIKIDDVKNILNESRYDNPRNQDITSEIIEILDLIL